MKGGKGKRREAKQGSAFVDETGGVDRQGGCGEFPNLLGSRIVGIPVKRGRFGSGIQS